MQHIGWGYARKGTRLIAALVASIVYAQLGAQGTWTWQQQCSSNEWSAICYDYAGCGYDQNNNPVHRYFNNWGHSQCSVSPGLPGPGSIILIPTNTNPLLASNVDIKSVLVSSGTVFDWQSGSLTLRDPSNNNAPGTFTNQGLVRVVGNISRSLSGVLVNAGTLVHQAGGTDFNGATLRNSSLLELQSGTLYNNSGTNLIENTGTLRKTTTNSFIIAVPLRTQNATMEVQAGSLSLTGAGDYRPNTTWTVASGATLLLNGSTPYTFTGTHSGAIAGSFVQTAGTVGAGGGGAVFNFTGNGFAWQSGTLNGGADGLTNQGLVRVVGNISRSLSGVLVNAGTLVHQAGGTDFNGATLRNSSLLELQSGTLYNNSGTNLIENTSTGSVYKSSTSGTFVINVPFTNDGGQVRVAGGTLQFTGNTLNRNASYRFEASAATVLYPSATHQFEGDIVLASNSALGQVWLTGGVLTTGAQGATWRLPYGVFHWQSGTLSVPNGFTIGSVGGLSIVGSTTRSLSGVLVNAGTLVHQAGGTDFNGATLRNSSLLELQSGTLYNNSGTNLIENTGTLRKTTTNSFVIAVPLRTQNATMEVQAGSLSLTGAGDYRPNTTWTVASGATLLLNGSTPYTFTGTHSGAIAGSFVQTAGTVGAGGGGAVFNFTGNGFAWQSGTLNGGADGLTNQGLVRVVGNISRSLSGVLVNAGTLVHQAGGTDFNGATLRNSNLLELQSGTLYNNSGTNLIENTGTLRKVSPDPNNPTSFTILVTTTNSGLIEVQSGSLSLTRLAQTGGETRIHRGTTLSVSNPMQQQGGKLTGAGTLNAALNLTAGTIAPGIDDPDNPDLNPLGILSIRGNLTMGADAVLEVELTGTNNSDPANPQYDQLIVGQSSSTPTVQLNGTLRVKGRDGFTPTAGDTFDIILRDGSWNRSGSFATVEVDPDTLPCVVFEVQYLSDRVRLLVQMVGSPDINRDGCVDDADLLAVLFAFGQTGSGLAEDTNCDGVVDDADLLNVLFNFGQGC